MLKIYLKGIGMLMGMIIGAGFFALPYSFAQAGLFWGIFHFAIVFLILIFLHILYGKISYYTPGEHRFVGYVELFLGKRAKKFSFLIVVLSYYGILLVYGLLAGFFLSNILGDPSIYIFSFLFFIGVGLISFLNFKKIALLNLCLTIPLFCFVIFLFFTALPFVNFKNILGNFEFAFNRNWFLPYGIWFFSLSGFSVIPEIRDFFIGLPIKNIKRVILISLVLAALVYLLFIFSVFGVSGSATTKDALSGLANIIGLKALIIGSFVGFLAVANSYLALSADMKNIFIFDYKIPKISSWLLVVTPPIGLFLMSVQDFVRIIEVIGVLGLGVYGVFIILMGKKMKGSARGNNLENFVLIAIIAGVLCELWRIFL